jgi:hypothetical protein
MNDNNFYTKFNFKMKEREEEMYNQLVRRFIKLGYKPLNNITCTFSFSCKQTKRSSNTKFNYPYTIIIKNYSLL